MEIAKLHFEEEADPNVNNYWVKGSADKLVQIKVDVMSDRIGSNNISGGTDLSHKALPKARMAIPLNR